MFVNKMGLLKILFGPNETTINNLTLKELPLLFRKSKTE